ncbi:MAG TPA: magnesium/cobalt transporter CorA [Capsulimonadaceae bacterium]|jgi:magnesium transporter
MIVVHHPDGKSTDHSGDASGAIDEVFATTTPTWVDCTALTAEELNALASRLSLHPLAVEDVAQGNQRPRVARYEDHTFVILHELPTKESDADPKSLTPYGGRGADIYAFFGPKFFVTIHKDRSIMTEAAIARWKASRDMQKRGRLLQLYLVIDSVIDEYVESLDGINDQVADLEDIVISSAEQNGNAPRKSRRTRIERVGMVRHLLGLRRSLLDMRRSVSHTRDTVNVLLRQVESLSDEDRQTGEASQRECFAYYQDAYDHAMRIVDSLDTYRDLLSGVLDAHLAVTSNRLNEVVKVLTSVSIILMSLGLVTGLYGMNFVYMPELHWKYGYGYAIGLMALVTITQWLYFRRKRWI